MAYKDKQKEKRVSRLDPYRTKKAVSKNVLLNSQRNRDKERKEQEVQREEAFK